MMKELMMVEDEEIPQNGSVAIVFQVMPTVNEVSSLIHSGNIISEMADAIRNLGFDCSEYTDEELAEAYKEIVGD